MSTGRPSTHTRCDVGRGRQRERLGQRVVGAVGVAQRDVEGRRRPGAQPERVEPLARRRGRRRRARPEASAPAAVARWSRWAGCQRQPLVAEQLLQEVGLQALLEQGEAGAGADVGAQRDAHARLDVALAAGTARCPARSCWSGSARRRRPGRRAASARRRWGARCARARCGRPRGRGGRRRRGSASASHRAGPPRRSRGGSR